MTGNYKNTSGSEYEVYYGTWINGRTRETKLLCKRTKCQDVPDAVLNEPYPIEKSYVEKMLKLGLWEKVEEKGTNTAPGKPKSTESSSTPDSKPEGGPP